MGQQQKDEKEQCQSTVPVNHSIMFLLNYSFVFFPTRVGAGLVFGSTDQSIQVSSARTHSEQSSGPC